MKSFKGFVALMLFLSAFSANAATITWTGAINSGSGATITVTTGGTSALLFDAVALASSLTQSSGVALTVNGNVTINQPTASSLTTFLNYILTASFSKRKKSNLFTC